MPTAPPLSLTPPKFTPVRARCRNCKRLYLRKYETQLYCVAKCRTQFNNYGKTPTEQLVRRLNSFMRTDEFRAMLRAAVEKEVARQLQKNGEQSGTDSASIGRVL